MALVANPTLVWTTIAPTEVGATDSSHKSPKSQFRQAPPPIEIVGYDSFSPSDVILGLVEVKMILHHLHTQPYLIILIKLQTKKT